MGFLGNVVGAITKPLFGGDGSAGMFGTGSYKMGEAVKIDDKAFKDEEQRKLREQERLNLKEQAANRPTPTIESALIERVKGPQAAQIGPTKGLSDQAGTINQAPQAEMRQGQTDLINQLQARARGEAPSLAQQELKRATDRNLAAVMAAQASNRGQGAQLASRNVARQQAMMQQQAAGQMSDLALQEQLAAENQLGQALQAGRGQDIGLAQTQAQLGLQRGITQAELEQAKAIQQAGLQQEAGLMGSQFDQQRALQQAALQQQTAQANQSAALQANAQREQAMQYYLSQGYTADQAAMQAAMDLQKLRVGQQTGMEQIGAGAHAATQDSRSGLMGGITGGLMQGAGMAAGLAAFSDKTTKKNIKDGNKDVQSFLDAISAKLYEYKDNFKKKDGAGEGMQIGIITQDLEKTPMGGEMVFNNPEENKKMILPGAGFGAMLASLAQINERLKAIEGK